jgi:hypothetical protein
MAPAEGSASLPDHVLTSPWWINHHEGAGSRRQRSPGEPSRSRREFASMAAQLGLAAWMVGALLESACFPVVPRPTAAQVLGSTVNGDTRTVVATPPSDDRHRLPTP